MARACLKGTAAASVIARANGTHLSVFDMGIGNTTASSALLSVFSDLPPEQVTGRGSLINDATLERKTAIIQQALQVNQPSKDRLLEVLAKIGGMKSRQSQDASWRARPNGCRWSLTGLSPGPQP